MNLDMTVSTQWYYIKPALAFITVMMVILSLSTAFLAFPRGYWGHFASLYSIVHSRLRFDSIWVFALIFLMRCRLNGFAFFGSIVLSIILFVSSEIIWVAAVFHDALLGIFFYFWIIGISRSLGCEPTLFTPTGSSGFVFAFGNAVELIVILCLAAPRTFLLHSLLHKRERSGLSPECVTKQVARAYPTIYGRRSFLFGDAHILSWSGVMSNG